MTGLQTDLPAVDSADSTFDQRWAAWLARGRARDIRSNMRMNVVRGLVVVGLGGWLWTTLSS